MYYILYRTCKDNEEDKIPAVCGDCDPCHDYYIRVKHFNDKHDAYAFLISHVAEIYDHLDDLDNEDYEKFDKFDDLIQNIPSFSQLEKDENAFLVLKKFSLEMLVDLYKTTKEHFSMQYLDVEIGTVIPE